MDGPQHTAGFRCAPSVVKWPLLGSSRLGRSTHDLTGGGTQHPRTCDKPCGHDGQSTGSCPSAEGPTGLPGTPQSAGLLLRGRVQPSPALKVTLLADLGHTAGTGQIQSKGLGPPPCGIPTTPGCPSLSCFQYMAPPNPVRGADDASCMAHMAHILHIPGHKDNLSLTGDHSLGSA